MVEGQIIPRLLGAHPAQTAAEGRIDELDNFVDANTVRDFARIILSSGPDAYSAFLQRLQARGVGSERLYTELLAPTALVLADLWDEDDISSAEATIGLGRLRHIVRELESTIAYNGESDPSARSCLFSPRVGEQQTFGFYMIEELFRWSGWRTSIETAATDADMVADVSGQWFDMFCLSVSRSTDLQDVATTIDKVRRASCNRNLFVMLNGRPFSERPDLVAKVGADTVASSGREALYDAEKAVWRLATA